MGGGKRERKKERAKKKASMTPKELGIFNKKQREDAKRRRDEKRAAMSPEEVEEATKKRREDAKRRRDEKRAAMSPEEVEAAKKKKREDGKRQRDEKRAAMSPEEVEAAKKKKREDDKRRRDEKRATMSPEDLEAAKKKRSEDGKRRRDEKRAAMSPEELEATKKEKRESEQRRREERKAKKAFDAKGCIIDEQDWLVTSRFLESEKLTESDGKCRDAYGRHYLGDMNQVCMLCNARGFETEIQGTYPNPDDPDSEEKLVDFGDLCCCKGRVKGIHNYKLPKDLEQLYTSDEPLAKHFREDARTYNNGMAMCSLTASKGWRTRAHNNKMTSMLTAGGQLFRRLGSLMPQEGGQPQPKCVQTYFYGGVEATKWRMLNIRKTIRARDKSFYEAVFKKLHGILTEQADNRYIKSFLGVKEYVEKHLKDKVRDVKLAIHANESPSSLIHKGRLNAPTVKEVAILLPSDDTITKDHNRYKRSILSPPLTFFDCFLFSF